MSQDLAEVYRLLRSHIIMIRVFQPDAFGEARHCKQELYQLKCWLDDEYRQLPRVPGEQEWEQKRLMDRLSRP